MCVAGRTMCGSIPLFFFVFLSFAISASLAARQKEQNKDLSACDPQRAIMLVQQQLDEAKKVEDIPARVTLLAQAADLLWDSQLEKARSVFAEAFEIASGEYRKTGDVERDEGRLTIRSEDPRFIVLRAIAKRDPAWARKLTEEAAAESADLAKKLKQAGLVAPDVAGKMFELALSMLDSDPRGAAELAAKALDQPASEELSRFLLQLDTIDHSAAGKLAKAALSRYAEQDLEGMFYLSPYVFGLHRPIGPVTIGRYYEVAENYSPDPGLQRAFLSALFNKAEQSVQSSGAAPERSSKLAAQAELYMALKNLEEPIAKYLPDLSEQAAAIESRVEAAMPADQRLEAQQRLALGKDSSGGLNPVDISLERAEKEADVGRKDGYLAQAVLRARPNETLDRLEDILAAIRDPKLRRSVSDWLYYSRTLSAVKDGSLDEARALAKKVDSLELRAYLGFEIAREAFKDFDDLARAKEILDDVESSAMKAPASNNRARTLLGVAHLYSRIDSLRAIEVTREAVKAINALDKPDFSSSSIIHRIESPTFRQYATLQVKGFSIQKAFEEIGPADFETALGLAGQLKDRTLRTEGTLALAGLCLRAHKRGAGRQGG